MSRTQPVAGELLAAGAGTRFGMPKVLAEQGQWLRHAVHALSAGGCDDIVVVLGAAVVFGNPSNRLGQPLTTLSPLYGAKALDLCNGADPVCSSGNDVPAHSTYVQAGLVAQGAAFAASRV